LKQVVRIQGLVKLADQVRVEIGRGMSGARKQQFQQHVSDATRRIEEILRHRNAREADLAAPSRRAYRFLKDIQWGQVQEQAAGAAAPPAPLRWTGLAPFAQRMMARLARPVPEAELAEIAGAIEQMSRRIERSIEQTGVGPEQMTAPTRQWRAWFAWLAERENLEAYITAASRARAAFEPAARAAGRRETIIIEFRPMQHLYKMQTRAGRATIQMPTPMVRFEGAALEAMTGLIFRRDKAAKRTIVEEMRGEAYQDVASELEALGGVVERTLGAFHDLAESFNRVNQRYFGGAMQKPRLTWSRSFTGRKFGHYDHLKDWVMVSSTLDQAQVPAFVVDYLMFHELLHKKHGVRWVNGRGYAHTREFYAEEQRFDRYEEADAWLPKLARG
jgi:hypothetical protein